MRDARLKSGSIQAGDARHLHKCIHRYIYIYITLYADVYTYICTSAYSVIYIYIERERETRVQPFHVARIRVRVVRMPREIKKIYIRTHNLYVSAKIKKSIYVLQMHLRR